MTDRYAVAGNPVEHSQSPFIHAIFAAQTGEALVYGRLLCPLDGFAHAVRQFSLDKSLGPVLGCNVTVPFKLDAFRLASQVTERARLAQAANLLRFDAPPPNGGWPDDNTDSAGWVGDNTDSAGWLGDNTDGAGLVRDIEHNAATKLAGQRVLLIGAGGAAAGALGPLLSASPAQLVVANRSLDRAIALVERHSALATASSTALEARTLDDCGAAFDVVINASASSLQQAAVPVNARVLKPGALALDMMYGPAAKPFLAWAAQYEARGRDGLGMLVEQAAEAFWVWRGVRPQTAPVLAALTQRMAEGER